MDVKKVLRWCAMPFASIIGAYITYVLISLNDYAFEAYSGVEIKGITQIILAIAAQAAFGAAFVFCGAITAPTNRRICAIILSTVVCVSCVLIFVLSTNMNGFGFMRLTHYIATMVGSIYAAIQFEDDKDEEVSEEIT